SRAARLAVTVDVDLHAAAGYSRRAVEGDDGCARLLPDLRRRRDLERRFCRQSRRRWRVVEVVVPARNRTRKRAGISGVLRLMAADPHDAVIDDEDIERHQDEDGQADLNEDGAPLALQTTDRAGLGCQLL